MAGFCIISSMEEKTRDFRYGKLPLPVGKSDWEEVAGHCYCVDKTLLMRDFAGDARGRRGTPLRNLQARDGRMVHLLPSASDSKQGA